MFQRACLTIDVYWSGPLLCLKGLLCSQTLRTWTGTQTAVSRLFKHSTLPSVNKLTLIRKEVLVTQGLV